MTTNNEITIDVEELRSEIKSKYAEVVETPDGDFHFHTGRMLAEHLGYPTEQVDELPDAAVESFAGIANPFALRDLEVGEIVVDLGSGAGFDSFLAAQAVGPTGNVVGVDMTDQMLTKSRTTAAAMGVDNVEFRDGYLEELPITDEFADVVIANGVINLCPSKRAALEEALRVLRPGGVIQFADIANGVEVPEAARGDIDLWTG
jgi:arsenite methyltransferase